MRPKTLQDEVTDRAERKDVHLKRLERDGALEESARLSPANDMCASSATADAAAVADSHI